MGQYNVTSDSKRRDKRKSTICDYRSVVAISQIKNGRKYISQMHFCEQSIRSVRQNRSLGMEYNQYSECRRVVHRAGLACVSTSYLVGIRSPGAECHECPSYHGTSS